MKPAAPINDIGLGPQNTHAVQPEHALQPLCMGAIVGFIMKPPFVIYSRVHIPYTLLISYPWVNTALFLILRYAMTKSLSVLQIFKVSTSFNYFLVLENRFLKEIFLPSSLFSSINIFSLLSLSKIWPFCNNLLRQTRIS